MTRLIAKTLPMLFLASGCLISVTTAQAQSNDSLSSVLSTVDSKWASLSSGSHGYRLRILNDQQKKEVESTLTKYREALSNRDNREVYQRARGAYSKLPLDVRRGQLFAINRVGKDYVWLEAGKSKAVVPLQAVELILLGLEDLPRSREGGRLTRPSQSGTSGLLGALMEGAGDGALVGGMVGSDGSLVGSVLGSTGSKSKENEPKQGGDAAKINMMYLKYANVADVGKVLNDVFENQKGTKIVVEPRLNALILQAPTETLKEITELVEQLDQRRQ